MSPPKMLSLTTISLFLTATWAQTYSAVGTFNDYGSQGYNNNACHYTDDGGDGLYGGHYAVAVGDLSPNLWSGPQCGGTPDEQCTGDQGTPGTAGPSCSEPSCGGTCGRCLQICNEGAYDQGATVGGIGNCVIAKVVDACPWESQYNWCKKDVDPAERCSAKGVNAVDIDSRLRGNLTDGVGDSNLKVNVQFVSC